MDIVESQAGIANYAVLSGSGTQFAWFALFMDAEEFVNLHAFSERYEIVKLTRG